MRHYSTYGLRCALSLLVLVLVPALALAQYGEGRPRQPEVQREPLQCSGTVKQIARGIIGVVTDAGEQWLVQVQARPQDLSFKGTADGSFVKAGMWVRFSSQLSRRGEAKEPISSLEIYTPREGYGVGVNAEGSGGGGGGALFGGGEEKPKAAAKTDENTIYQIGGQVTKISRLGELTINAGGTTVKAKLADDAKVSIDMADLAFLQAGDKIEFRGWYAAGRKGQAVADQVTASASHQLTDTSKKKKVLPLPMSAAEGVDFNPEKPAADEKKPEAKAADEKKAE